MSIPMDTLCMECQFRRNAELARSLGDEETATEFLRRWMEIVISMRPEAPSPCSGPATNKLLHEMYGLELDRYREEKAQSNRIALEHLADVRTRVEQAEDRLYAALQFAIAGNYLDFSALQGKISFAEFQSILDGVHSLEIDRGVYDALREDLQKAQKLLYLTDNAGEIVFDRVLAEELHRAYPGLSITFCVRGGIAANDATREDAAAVGIPFPVIDSGSNVAGTPLDQLGEEADRAIRESDVILAKGMANTETMLGCGYNVYYAFLVKCPRFVERFGRPMFTPILAPERAEKKKKNWCLSGCRPS